MRLFLKLPRIFLSYSRLSPRFIRKMNTSEFILENTTPIINLDCKQAFENLTDKEQKYLHNYTKVNKRIMQF